MITKGKSSTNTDILLWDLFRKGDKQAFSMIYNLHIRALYGYGLKLSADSCFVMDCIHDLFIDLSNSKKSLSDTNNIRFYLIRSLKNKIIRKKKYKDHQTTGEYPFFLEASGNEKFEDSESVKMKRIYLRNAINELPARQKEVIYLRYIHGFNNDEIAKIMDINYQVVRNTLCKAIENLRKSISKEDLLLFLISIRKQRKNTNV